MKRNKIENGSKLFVLLVVMFLVNSTYAQFVHPGIWHKKSDLDRMKFMVEAEVEPWITSFRNLQADSYYSNYNYNVRKDPNDNTLSRENPSHQRNQYEQDTRAAYNNAILWYITEDERYAEKAVEILNAWSSLVNFYGGGTEALSAGIYGAPLINAAEIIRYTYDGWEAADIQKFADMLVYPGYSNTVVPQSDIDNDNVTFYWRTYNGDPGRAGNQGLLAWRTVMAIGVFLDNQIIYDRALRQIRGYAHRVDDFPYPSGPPINGTTPNVVNEHFIDWPLLGRENTIIDYGYDDQIQHYILPNGQCEESSRDQVHSSLGIAAVADLAEMAWNQGDDVYSYLDDRLLKGIEFTAKYNLSYENSYPDQLSPWEPTVESGEYIHHTNRTGRREALKINPYVTSNYDRWSRGLEVVSRPVYEMQAAHYSIREDKSDEAIWLNRIRDYSIEVNGYEQGDGLDALGWGGLTFRRPEGCAGDPIIGFENNVPNYGVHNLPLTIEAEHFDYFVGNSVDRVYHDESSGNTGGIYRINEDVDIIECSEGGYNISSIEDGEWLIYTVNVPSDGTYDIDIRYASVNANGKIKFNFGGVDITSEVTVPFGTSNSSGITDWQDFKVGEGVRLNKGVQAMKVLFSGADDAFELNNITVSLITADPDPINLAPLHGTASQSIDSDPCPYGGCAELAIDGNTNGNFGGGSVSHSAHGTSGSLKWWEVDLGNNYNIETINIYNRTGYENRLLDITVEIRDTNGTVVFNEFYPGYPNPFQSIETGGVVGSVVRISKTSDTGITLAEVEVYGVDRIVTLSNNDFTLKNKVDIYPNPTSNNFTITNSLNSSLNIYDIQGKLMMQTQIESNNHSVDISHFNMGMYFVQINNNGRLISKKIIKK